MRGPDRWAGQKGELYVVVQIGLFSFIAGGPWMGRVPTGIANPWAAGVGLLLMLAGGFGSAAALRSLGTNLSVLPHPKEGAQLVVRGLYAYVRHPIYGAVLLLSLGWVLLWESFWSALGWGLLLVLFDQKARREERLLAERFANYLVYKQKVKRLIPWIY